MVEQVVSVMVSFSSQKEYRIRLLSVLVVTVIVYVVVMVVIVLSVVDQYQKLL